MFNADVLEESIKLTVLPSPVGLNLQDFAIKETFDMRLKAMKDIENIGFMLKTEQPSKFAKIIYETQVNLLKSSMKLT